MATINPGLDASGNGNNWAPVNINFYTSSSYTYDVMTDVPTNTSATVANYATLNPLSPQGAAIVVSAGNLQFTRASTGDVNTLGTFGMSSGKWYWEVYSISNNSGTATTQLGIANSSFNTFTSPAGNSANAWVFTSGAFKANNNTYTSGFGSTWSTGDTLMIAFDADNGKVWFGRNGTWIASGDPAAGTNAAFSSLASGTYFFVGGINGSADNMAANFGQRPFTYTPPTGFNNCNTYNLPTPTIGATASSQARNYENVVTYTGTGTSGLAITGVGFKPDLVWIKQRDAVVWHNLQDSVRGSGRSLFSNDASAEYNDTGTRQVQFDTDGFTLIGSSPSNSDINQNGKTYVAWCWRANQGTNVTNTNGSITSTVSANTTSGFSVVTYTGNGSTGATVGHGLGVAPKMIIVKQRNGTNYWTVYQASVDASPFSYILNLNTTSAKVSTSQGFQAASSSTFTIGTDVNVNGNGSTYVAYCFSEVAGFSKFGSYTGNGSTDGPFVYCGFRPRFVMFKNASGVAPWCIMDTARSTYNVESLQIYPNASDAEFSTATLDGVSNGFKIRSSAGGPNNLGDTIIYAAFAESPFKYANAR